MRTQTVRRRLSTDEARAVLAVLEEELGLDPRRQDLDAFVANAQDGFDGWAFLYGREREQIGKVVTLYHDLTLVPQDASAAERQMVAVAARRLAELERALCAGEVRFEPTPRARPSALAERRELVSA